MSDTRPDQTEEILSYEISDEALESAAGTKRAARYTLYYCTALDLCPVPSHCALNSATHLLACRNKMGMDRASTSLNQGSAKMAGASEAADAEQIRLVEAQILECNLPEARVFLREDADVGEIDPSDGTRSITGIVSLGVIEDGSKKPAVHVEFRTLGNDFPTNLDIDLMDVMSINCGQS